VLGSNFLPEKKIGFKFIFYWSLLESIISAKPDGDYEDVKGFANPPPLKK